MPGSILIAPETLRLGEGYVVVRPLGERPVKGLDAPIEVFEVVGAGTVRSRLQAAAARGLTRFVGRDAEVEQLRSSWARPAASRPTATSFRGGAAECRSPPGSLAAAPRSPAASDASHSRSALTAVSRTRQFRLFDTPPVP
jgi:hypothetical protein